MKRIIFFTFVSSILALVVLGLFISRDGPDSGEDAQPSYVFPSLPDDATYQIGDLEVSLRDGAYEKDGVVISLINTYVSGDVDGDTDDDAVLVLEKRTDDAPLEHYLGVALYENSGYLGLTTIPLDAAPTEVRVRDELIEVVYQSGSEGDEIHTDRTRYFAVNTAIEIFEVIPQEGVDMFRGMYSPTTSGAFFTPCGGEITYKLSTESNSLAALRAIAAEKNGGTTATSGDMYVVLTGTIVAFEAEEDSDTNTSTFSVRSIVRVPAQENVSCHATATEESISQ